jgi:aminoglycoside phosphotransferase
MGRSSAAPLRELTSGVRRRLELNVRERMGRTARMSALHPWKGMTNERHHPRWLRLKRRCVPVVVSLERAGERRCEALLVPRWLLCWPTAMQRWLNWRS